MYLRSFENLYLRRRKYLIYLENSKNEKEKWRNPMNNKKETMKRKKNKKIRKERKT